MKEAATQVSNGKSLVVIEWLKEATEYTLHSHPHIHTNMRNERTQEENNNKK